MKQETYINFLCFRRARGEMMTQDSQSDNNTSSSDSSDECLSNHQRLSNSSSPESTPQKILNKIHLDTPPQSVQNSPSSRDGISFESMCRETSSQDGVVSLGLYVSLVIMLKYGSFLCKPLQNKTGYCR